MLMRLADGEGRRTSSFGIQASVSAPLHGDLPECRLTTGKSLTLLGVQAIERTSKKVPGVPQREKAVSNSKSSPFRLLP